MFNSVYFLIILIFACLICLFFIIFNLYYNERYLGCVCGSNLCAVLTILLIVLYKTANENWALKGLTSVIFSCGVFLGCATYLVIMKIPLKKWMCVSTIVILGVDFICFPFYISISVFLHKIILTVLLIALSFKLLSFKKRNLIVRLLVLNNVVFGVIQWVFAFLFYYKGAIYFFWDNMAYIIQNIVISMLFVCLTIQEAKEGYVQKVDELQDEIVLGQKQLQESYEKNQLKSTFFADLSHELKTPINVIYSNIQLFEKCMLADDQKIADPDKYLQSMQKNCYRLIKLVNNIIDMNKIESGYMEIQLKNYNIIPFIEDMVMSINAYAMEKQIGIIFDTEVEELIVACDMDKIEKIVLNLLSNSIKYTPAGGEILVYISNDSTNTYISVQDTGEGIPEALHEIIFDRFMQNKGDLHQKHNSSGIGLALVKSLVELHQGSIWIDKEYKEGCKITFAIPLLVLDDIEPILYKNAGYGEYNIEFI